MTAMTPSAKEGLFSVVVPVFQNEANLGETIPRLLALAPAVAPLRLELVFVEDGSSDRSRAMLAAAASAHPGLVRVVCLTRNFGQTPAIQAGLRHAAGACVGVISCDLQEPPEALVEMVGHWKKGTKFVIGERVGRDEPGLSSSIYWLIVRRFVFADYPRLGFDCFLLDRQVVDSVNRINEKNTSIFALIYWLGYRPVRVPLHRQTRRLGRSQWRIAAKIRFTFDTLIGFSYAPARSITWLGLATGTGSLLYLLALTWRWHFYQLAPPGWMTLIGFTILLGAIILFALGIISEYLLRILDETRKRPPFEVEEIIEQRSQPGPGP
ncbi:MAG: glycosyl transferase family 2 [Verrucomicrobia bacterium]|nr:glycosyl transferase family 2 [Verrucomicrobiota bacterium]